MFVFGGTRNGFQKLEKIKDANRQSRQLEDLTDKMRDCKSLIKDFDREVKSLVGGGNDANTNRMLNDRRQSMVRYPFFILTLITFIHLNSRVFIIVKCLSAG